MKDIVLKYGIRSGLLMAVLSWLSYFLTQGMSYMIAQIASVAVIVIALLPLMGAMKASRSQSGGVITFWQAFFTGAISAVVAGGVMALSTLIWAFTMSASYADDQSVMLQPAEQAVIMFLMVLFFGSIVSLLMAIVVRKDSGNPS